MSLERRTPLRRGGLVKRSRARLKPLSDKRRAELDDWAATKAVVAARDRGRCRAATVWPEVACGGPIDPHHIGGRWSKQRRLDPDLVLSVCRRHHDAIGASPQLAKERGLLL